MYNVGDKVVITEKINFYVGRVGVIKALMNNYGRWLALVTVGNVEFVTRCDEDHIKKV